MTDTKIPMRIFTSYEALTEYYGERTDMELGLYVSDEKLLVGHTPTAYSFNPQYFTGVNELEPNYVPASPIDYTINVAPNDTTYGYATGGGTYPEHTEITVNAYAYYGYKFDKWSNDVETAAYTFAVEEDANLVANFVDNTYTVTTRPSAPGIGTTTGDGVYIAGTSVTVTATPAEGYYFADAWRDEDTLEYVSADAEYTFTVEKNTNLMAIFAPYFTVSATPNNVDYGSTTGSGNQYKYNDSVTVTATAESGYRFVNWTEGGVEVSTSSSYTFTIGFDDVTLVANFEPNTANISIYASPAGYGSVDAAGSTVIGESYTVIAGANTGYRFVNWTENGTEVSTSANYTFTVTGDRTLVANFDIDPLLEPFYVENITNENETLSITKTTGWSSSSVPEYYMPTLTIEYSTDKTNWSTLGTTSTTALTRTITPGEKLYLRCNTTAWAANYGGISVGNAITGVSKVGGNVLSLLYGSTFNGQNTFLSNKTTDRTLADLFYKNTNLVSADKLILPTNTKSHCYDHMLCRCNKLVDAPVLPATIMSDSCYYRMFYDCRALVTAPALPATRLANYCYYSMFRDCRALVNAPELLATTLINNCYGQMFYSCNQITSIKCLATTFGTNSTTDWLNSGSATGTFTKATGATWSTGASGIPSGWTVEEV